MISPDCVLRTASRPAEAIKQLSGRPLIIRARKHAGILGCGGSISVGTTTQTRGVGHWRTILAPSTSHGASLEKSIST
ncbi:hypothetical protein GY45DRAFT_1330156 [Cubamyces sp. BRFM 1775]|nr:hypothetical protein GY45DRAFT_1330156 [Cubamyces sp. BRFM 1775]